MDLADLTLEVRDRDLNRLGQVRPEDLDFELTDQFNNVGQWTLTIPSEHPLADALRTPGAGIILSGPNGFVFSGPTIQPTRKASPMDLAGTLTINGVSDSVVLADRLVFPVPTSDTAAGQTESHDVREGPAETLMHEYVAANCGPLAPSSRRQPNLVMGVNGARGPVKKKSARFPVLGSLLAELAAVGSLGFRVVQRGGQLVFETFEVLDRSAEIRLDIENGTLAGQTSTTSAPSVTHVIVAGQGEGVDRAFLFASTPESISAGNEWGRRIEQWVDQRQTDDENEYRQRADEVLQQGGFTGVQVQVVPLDDETSTMRFGYDWGLGDQVTVVEESVENTQIVTGYKLKVDSTGFTLGSIIGGGETSGTSLTSRVSAIERNAESISSSDLKVVSDIVAAHDSAIATIETQLTSGLDTWHDLTLASPWVNYSTDASNWPTLQYMKLPGGEVAIRGILKGGTPGAGPIATLPEDVRPSSQVLAICSGNAPGYSPAERAIRIDISPDGRIFCQNSAMNAGATGGFVYLSLFGIRFHAA